jgi:predicted alpha/beta-fold hydrolase
MAAKFKLDFEKLKTYETWREFDDEYTIKANPSFSCVAEYYNQASCLHKVKDIKVPTLVLQSRDDPIVPVDCLPIDECVANENVITALTRFGGHVWYFEGANVKSRWFTHATTEFLNKAME